MRGICILREDYKMKLLSLKHYKAPFKNFIASVNSIVLNVCSKLTETGAFKKMCVLYSVLYVDVTKLFQKEQSILILW